MKFGTTLALFAAVSMMFAVAYAEDEAAAVVATTEAAAEEPVTGAVSGGEATKEPAAGSVTGAAGGAAVEVITSSVAPAVTSDAPASVPTVETSTKGTQSFASGIFAVACLLLVTLLQ